MRIWQRCWAHLAKILNQRCISFSTAPAVSFLDKSSFRKLGTLVITLYLKVRCNQLKLFCMAIKTITWALTNLSLIPPSNNSYWQKDSNVRLLINVFCKKTVSKTHFSWDYYICVILFFPLLSMLINTVSDDFLMYIGFYFSF